MLALSTATQVTSLVAFFFLALALLIFLRLLLRKGPPHWTQIRLGVYIERVPEQEPSPPTTWQKPDA